MNISELIIEINQFKRAPQNEGLNEHLNLKCSLIPINNLL